VLLAGDVGGTKTLLGLFERAHPRPRLVVAHTYLTNGFTSFNQIIDSFAADIGAPFVVEAAAAGVAGPVVGSVARLTNVAWDIDRTDVAAHVKTGRVRLLNDLEAMALGATALAPDDLLELQRGTARSDGNAAVIAAGTGLGQAYLHRVDGRLTAMASEGGHGDFAARTDREMAFVRMLRDLYGRAEVEHVLSGPGILNLHRFTHDGGDCNGVEKTDPLEAPAQVTRNALEGRCGSCAEALEMFVDAYGAEAGNLALRGVATSGVFVGGGIAPKILPAMQNGRFMEAFRAKGAFSALAAEIPVHIILAPDAGLLGAAVAAQALAAQA
jgi:glucokinase